VSFRPGVYFNDFMTCKRRDLRMQSVVITSGTLSPIDLYPRILDFNPVSIASLQMTLTRECLCPVVLTRGSDQMPVSTKFDMRRDEHVLRHASFGSNTSYVLCRDMLTHA
jgi:Rad3-related DNA helicase